MTKIKTFVFNDFQTNCYIIYDESYEAVIIDGAANSHNGLKQIHDFIQEEHLIPKYIMNTHGHLDHICGNYYLESHYRIPLLMHKDDDFLIENSLQLAKSFGFAIEQPPKTDKYIKDHEIIKFGDTKLEVISTPGHTPGSVSFYCSEENFVISGDTLFCEGIGRTDLPRGDYDQLMHSITSRLFSLALETKVLPGHGPDTTIGDEKKYNPFFSNL